MLDLWDQPGARVDQVAGATAGLAGPGQETRFTGAYLGSIFGWMIGNLGPQNPPRAKGAGGYWYVLGAWICGRR